MFRRGRRIKSETKKVCNVFAYFERQAKKTKFSSSRLIHVAKATGLSRVTVTRIKPELRRLPEGTEFSSPAKCYCRTRKWAVTNNFDREAIWRLIYHLCWHRNATSWIYVHHDWVFMFEPRVQLWTYKCDFVCMLFMVLDVTRGFSLLFIDQCFTEFSVCIDCGSATGTCIQVPGKWQSRHKQWFFEPDNSELYRLDWIDCTRYIPSRR